MNKPAKATDPCHETVPIKRNNKGKLRMQCTLTIAKNAAATTNTYDGFSDEERGAMKQRAQELKATAPWLAIG